MIPDRKWSPDRPQTANDPRCELQMIPPETTDGMDFGFLDFFKILFLSFFFFHQLKDKLDQIKEKINWQRVSAFIKQIRKIAANLKKSISFKFCTLVGN